MQAFVQQPHQVMTATQPNLQILQQKIQNQHTKRKHAKTSEPQQFIGTPDHYHHKEKVNDKHIGSGSIQQAYYTYSQTPSKQQSKADQRLAATAQQTYKRQSGQFSEPNSAKRNSQTAHSDSSIGHGTPKTPSTANAFRRKWNGGSSTKSHNSVSSTSATRQASLRTTQAIANVGFDDFSIKSSHCKKEKPRPPSAFSKNQGRSSARKDSTEKATIMTPLRSVNMDGTPTASQIQKSNDTRNKQARSNSSEIKPNKIDFTKKPQANLPIPQKQSDQITPVRSNRQIQTQNLAPAQQMPPKPQTSAKTAQKKGRQQSKSKSITRSNARDTLPPSGDQSQKMLRPVLERNGPQLGQGTSGAQSHLVMNTHKTTESAQSKSKKQRALLQTATVPHHPSSFEKQDKCETPGNTGGSSRARQRSRDVVCDTQTLLARRNSQQSPSKSNRVAATHQNSMGTRKQMTQMINSGNKLPTQQPHTHLTNSKVSVANRYGADSDSHQGRSSHEKPKENDEDVDQQHQRVKLKSHRVQMTGKEGAERQPGFVQIPSKRNRHRSTSNKKQQSNLQSQQTQEGTTMKRKKSTTRRKSVKRKQQEQYQQAPAELGKRGRSPHHQSSTQLATERVGAQDRHMSPSGAGQNFSTFRMRALKPKKTSMKEKAENNDHQQPKQGGSVSVERANNQIQVGLLGATEKGVMSHQQLLQSAQDSNSICSNKTYQTQPVNKNLKQRIPVSAQKQKMLLTNIQSQIVATGQRTLTGVQKKIKQESIKRAEKVDKKKNIHVDLMKASTQGIMTDIRIENRVVKLQQQDLTQSTSQASSVKSTAQKQQQQRANDKQPQQSRKSSAAKQCRSRSNDEQRVASTTAKDIKAKDGSASPKIVISMRQLENLLLSTQQQTIKTCNTTKAQTQASQHAKKQIIQNSIKQFQQSSERSGKSRQMSGKHQEISTPSPLITTQNFKPKKEKKSAKTTSASQALKNMIGHQLINLQPASMQVFNAISDQSSKNATPNAMRSDSSQMPQFNSMHDSIKMRTRSLERRHENSHQLLKATARTIKDKIHRQSANLLTLVQGQKMRARQMATQAQQASRPSQVNNRAQQNQKQDVIPEQFVEKFEISASPTEKRKIEKAASGGIYDSGQSYRDYSEETPLDQADEALSSSQRLQNLFYAKLESRQTNNDSQINQQVDEESKEITMGDASKVVQIKNLSLLKSQKKLIILRQTQSEERKEKKACQKDSGKSSTTSKQMRAQPELRRNSFIKTPGSTSELRVTAEMSRSHCRSIDRKHEESFLNRVGKTGESSQVHDEEKSNTSAVSSFKQPSLRLITNSHTSRSNKNRLCRQDSAAEIRPSQDPNASITLSRILLETSIQQSDKANGNANMNCEVFQMIKNVHSDATNAPSGMVLRKGDLQLSKAFNSTMGFTSSVPQMYMHRLQRLGSENATASIQDQHEQSLYSGEVLSEINPVASGLQQQDSNDQLRSIPRSLTNPDKFSSQNSLSKRKSPLQNYMIDEVWPTNSSQRKRTSSITSLTNSTPASRTLEQLQQQSFSPSAYQPVSPSQMQQKFLMGERKQSQSAFDDTMHEYQPQQEEPHVQDQGRAKQVSESHIESLSSHSSPNDAMQIQDTEAMISRGTSSPDRRRSPLKREIAANKSRSSSNILQPTKIDSSLTVPKDVEGEKIDIAGAVFAANGDISPPISTIDNDRLWKNLHRSEIKINDRRCALLTTSFNNDDVDYSDNEHGHQQVSQQPCDQNQAQHTQIMLPQARDIIGRGDTAAVQHMMTRSERGDESYEDAPFEKSQNEGLNVIMFQGNNNMRDEDEAQQQFIDIEEPESAQNLLSSINSQVENASTPQSMNQDGVGPQLTATDLAVDTAQLGVLVQSSNEENPSQLAAIEDILLLTPNTFEGIASLASLDSDQMINSQQQLDEQNWPKLEVGFKAAPEVPAGDQQLYVNSQNDKARVVVSPLDLQSTESRLSVQSETFTPKKNKNSEQQVALQQMESKTEVEKPKEEEDEDDVVDASHINFEVVERATSPAEMRTSVESDALEFEEAINTVDQLSANTQQHSADLNPTVTVNTFTEKSQESTSPKLRSDDVLAVVSSAAPSKKLLYDKISDGSCDMMYDIDSLNQIKKANDLASKKVEITNYIFEMLVSEVRENMFPTREDEEESTMLQEQNTQKGGVTVSKKKKKRKMQRRVKKPDVTPKVKEIKDGMPVDVCLKRIQSVTKVRNSINSGEFASLSGTQSLSLSKDTGRSYLDQTKSKEQIEISSQFHEIEHVKQEQMDLLQKKIALVKEKSSEKLEDDLKQLQSNLRGIKTTTDVVDSYLSTLFNNLLKGENNQGTAEEAPLVNYSEQDFLDDLATPLAQNAVQELQNIQVLAKQARDTLAESSNQKLFAEKKPIKEGEEKDEEQQERDEALEMALFGFAQQQPPVLSVELYLDIERQKDYVLLADSVSEVNVSITESLSQDREVEKDANESQDRQIKKQRQNLVENQSMLAEWENIHNKVLFDAVNDSLDEFRPYGLRGPPAPWSGQTRALTYRYSQNSKEVLQQVREKVIGLSKTFGGALANSELLKEYHIRGPLEQDKLQMLREERLAIMMMQDVEETQHKWENFERQETGVKVELADIILSHLTDEIVNELAMIEAEREF